jgi:hypothetical protein
MDTHMAHRPAVYEFPVPWCNINWGVHGEHLRDPATVRYLVLDRTLISDPRDKALLADLLSGEFRTVSDRSGILVAERVRRPVRPAGQNPPEGSCFARPALDPFQPDLQSAG